MINLTEAQRAKIRQSQSKCVQLEERDDKPDPNQYGDFDIRRIMYGKKPDVLRFGMKPSGDPE